MTILAELIRNTVLEHRDRVALVDSADGSEHTYSELDRSFNRVANALDMLGLQPGDHVGILQRNSHHWIACEGGLAKAGMVTVPLNVYLSPQELVWLLKHSDSRAVFLTSDEASLLEPLRADVTACKWFLCIPRGDGRVPSWTTDLNEILGSAQDSDPSQDISPIQAHRIMYTSATTGMPKGVICANWVFCGGIVTALANQLRDVSESDRFLAATPLTHMAGGFFWSFFARGATTVTMRQFSPEHTCEVIEKYGITHTVLVPTMIIMLLNYLQENPQAAERFRQGSLRAVWYAGSPIPISVAQEAEKVMGSILNQQYGFTEAWGAHPAVSVTQLTARWHNRKVGSCGRALIGSVVRVVDDQGNPVGAGELGEIVVKSEGLVGGYWNKSDETAGAYRAGWIHSGDIGYFDEDGFLYIKDRKDDMIISGGLNIYPTEVENVLSEHPAVYQCAVVGIPDPKWVEVPCAVVVRSSATLEVSEDELIEFVRGRLAHYKAPKRIIFVESLPISSVGKVLKRKIREELSIAFGDSA